MFIYNKRKFNEDQITHIEFAKKHKVDKEILKIMTKTKKGKPVYDSDQMGVIREGAERGLNISKISFYVKLNNYNEPIYNDSQMNSIMFGIVNGFPYSSVELYAKLNDKEKPIYNSTQMCEIYYALRWEMPMEDIMFLTQLNSKSEPIFDEEQMNVIFHAIKFSDAKKNMDIFTKIESEKPIYSAKEMQCISSFFIHADNNAARQMRECFESGISFIKLKPLLEHVSEANIIRVCRSLYELDFTENAIDFFLNEGCSYEDLKEVKYIANCMYKFTSDVDLDLKLEKFDMKYFREIAAAEIAKIYNSDVEVCEFIENCLEDKMEAEEIKTTIELKFLLNKNEIISEKENNLPEEDIGR